jgi:hypothetical protein
MQRVEEPLHRILHIFVALFMNGAVFVRIGQVGDQDVDMPDLPNEIVRRAWDREIPVHRKDLAILFPEEFHDVSAGVLVAVGDDHSFSCKSTGHFRLRRV